MIGKRIEGLIAPCITPFDENEQIDGSALTGYLHFLVEQVDWISVGAIYGSGIMMPIEQRKQLLELAEEAVDGAVNLSFFVGAVDTQSSVELAGFASRSGADAISCVAPFYYRQVDEALFRHYVALIEAASVPVYAYDSPPYAGNRLSIGLLNRLAEHGLAGVITGAVGDGIEHIWRVLRQVDKEGFSVLSIRDGLALPAMQMGAVGFESGVANYFPELVRELLVAIEREDLTVAAEKQEQLLRLRDISHELGKNIPSLHALISMRGLKTGLPKKPFFPLSEDEVSILERGFACLDFDTPLQARV